MIVFLDKPQLIPYLQTSKNIGSIPVTGGNCHVYNFSSLYSGYEDATVFLTRAAPINDTGLSMPEFVESPQFDFKYAAYIMNDPQLFALLVQIVCESFNGNLVVMLVQRDAYRDLFMESLIKLIQQRYGYQSWIVEDIEDIQAITEPIYTPMGLECVANDAMIYFNRYGKYPFEDPMMPYAEAM